MTQLIKNMQHNASLSLLQWSEAQTFFFGAGFVEAAAGGTTISIFAAFSISITCFPTLLELFAEFSAYSAGRIACDCWFNYLLG